MTTTRSKKVPVALEIPADACPACGTLMKVARGTLKLPVNGEEIAVPGARHLRCPKCHAIVLPLEDAKRLGEGAISVYRKRHGLLSAAEIRAVREHFGLTQAELASAARKVLDETTGP